MFYPACYALRMGNNALLVNGLDTSKYLRDIRDQRAYEFQTLQGNVKKWQQSKN